METIIDRISPPAVKEITSIEIFKAEKNLLDNGIPVYTIKAGFQDLVKIEFLFPNKGFDPSKPLLHSATNRMMAEGTAKYSAQQLADFIDYYGAFYETDENSDFSSVILYTLNKYLEVTLPYISEILQGPVFPASELQVFKQNNKQRLIVENEKVNSIARRKFNEVIFGEKHPYGYFTKTEDYDNLDRDSLLQHHKKKYIPANCTIIIAGQVKDDSVKLLNTFFGQQQNPASVNGQSANPAFVSSSSNKLLIEKEGAVQSAIRIGKQFFNRTHPDYPGMAVLNTLLGGYFGSRLMENIREDKGYTYGIGSAIVSMKQEGYFFISTEVGAEVKDSAIEEIYKEIELLRKEAVEEEELSMVRNYMLGTFLKGMDGAFQMAERFKSIYLYGLDYSYYDRYLEIIRTIKQDELLSLAKKYLEPSSFFEVIVGRK